MGTATRAFCLAALTWALVAPRRDYQTGMPCRGGVTHDAVSLGRGLGARMAGIAGRMAGACRDWPVRAGRRPPAPASGRGHCRPHGRLGRDFGTQRMGAASGPRGQCPLPGGGPRALAMPSPRASASVSSGWTTCDPEPLRESGRGAADAFGWAIRRGHRTRGRRCRAQHGGPRRAGRAQGRTSRWTVGAGGLRGMDIAGRMAGIAGRMAGWGGAACGFGGLPGASACGGPRLRPGGGARAGTAGGEVGLGRACRGDLDRPCRKS